MRQARYRTANSVPAPPLRPSQQNYCRGVVPPTVSSILMIAAVAHRQVRAAREDGSLKIRNLEESLARLGGAAAAGARAGTGAGGAGSAREESQALELVRAVAESDTARRAEVRLRSELEFERGRVAAAERRYQEAVAAVGAKDAELAEAWVYWMLLLGAPPPSPGVDVRAGGGMLAGVGRGATGSTGIGDGRGGVELGASITDVAAAGGIRTLGGAAEGSAAAYSRQSSTQQLAVSSQLQQQLRQGQGQGQGQGPGQGPGQGHAGQGRGQGQGQAGQPSAAAHPLLLDPSLERRLKAQMEELARRQQVIARLVEQTER